MELRKRTIYRAIRIAFAAFLLSGLLRSDPPLEWQSEVLPLAHQYAIRRNGKAGSSEDGPTPLVGVVTVVTGATSGIGLSLSKALHRLGATVVGVGRSHSKLGRLEEELPGLIGVQADFSDLESVRKAANEIQQRFAHIDILVNNAGVHDGSKMPTPSAQGFDNTFAVNYLAHFLLTEKLAVSLAAAKAPVILQMSSTYHAATDGSDLIPVPDEDDEDAKASPLASRFIEPLSFLAYPKAQRAYANSKLAQIFHARSLKRLHPLLEKARIVSVCPAWVVTGITRNAGVFQHFARMGSYLSDGWGLASTLKALFDSPPPAQQGTSSSSQELGDYYTNCSFSKIMTLLFNLVPRWTESVYLRDVLGFSLFSFLLFIQRHFPGASVNNSSAISYDQLKGDLLYSWSVDTVKPYI